MGTYLKMDISLSDSETRYYNDLFTLCDTSKIEKIEKLKATEFLRNSEIDNSILSQVSSKIQNLRCERFALCER